MNRERIKEMKEKDPQRFWGTVIIILIILLSIIGGIIYSAVSEEETEVSTNQIEGVEVPVDSLALKKDNLDKYSDNYFDLSEDTTSNEESIQEVKQEPSKPIYIAKPKGYYTSSNYSQPKKIEEPVLKQEDEPAKKSKKRVPNDGFTTNSSSSNSSMCKIVVDNRSRTVKNGSTVYFHSANEFTLSGVKVPKNTIIQGVATISGERVKITVSQLRIGADFHSVNWKVYDSGIEGIYVPEKLGDNVAKDGADQALDQGSKIETNVPVVGSVKLNLKKKNQESSVVLPDGYKCTLHE